MTLEEEVTKLTGIWYEYVNKDHHKDRDCHWYIHKTWSYGEEPYYQAYHHGYITSHWTSPKCGTEEMASTLLRDKLKRELHTAIIHLQDTLAEQDALNWLGKTREDIEKLIEELSDV